MSELKYENVYVPFATQIPGGLGVGRIIKIKGVTEYQREPRFVINLGVFPAFHQNIALHISPRHNERTIVITHSNGGIWGAEQIYNNPIHGNKDHFELKIYVEPGFYKIELRGHLLATVPFVFEPHAVNHIEIEGGVKIDHVHVEGHSVGIGGPMVVAPQVMMATAPSVVYAQTPQVVYAQAPPTVVVESNRHPVATAAAVATTAAIIADTRHRPVVVETRRPVVVERHGPVVVNRHGPVVVERGIGHRRF